MSAYTITHGNLIPPSNGFVCTIPIQHSQHHQLLLPRTSEAFAICLVRAVIESRRDAFQIGTAPAFYFAESMLEAVIIATANPATLVERDGDAIIAIPCDT